jgi:flagellar biosynthesis protein FlhG
MDSFTIRADQAQSLREKMTGLKNGLKIVTLASGKGGVGKSTIAVNLAVALAQLGIRVLVVDADFGLANVDVMLGVQTKYNLSHFLRGERRLDELVHISYDGVRFISGGNGLSELIKLGETQLQTLIRGFSRLDMPIDYILCDAGAGISDNIIQLILASSETIIVTTPEPTAILDAYALVKTIVKRDNLHPIHVIMNKTESRREAEHVLGVFRKVLSSYLGKDISCLGCMTSAPDVPRSIKRQVPVMVSSPSSRFAQEIRATARALLDLPPAKEPSNAVTRFFAGLSAAARRQ